MFVFVRQSGHFQRLWLVFRPSLRPFSPNLTARFCLIFRDAQLPVEVDTALEKTLFAGQRVGKT